MCIRDRSRIDPKLLPVMESCFLVFGFFLGGSPSCFGGSSKKANGLSEAILSSEEIVWWVTDSLT